MELLKPEVLSQVAKIPSCHCRIASDQAMLAKSMALSWRTDLFTPSPKVFRKRGWSIDIEAKHHLSVPVTKSSNNIPYELLTYIKHHETYIFWKKIHAFHLIWFHFAWFHQSQTKTYFTVRQGVLRVLTPTGEILLSYTKLARSRGATSTEVTSAILGAYCGTASPRLWTFIVDQSEKSTDMYRQCWGRNQETNCDWLNDQETSTWWAHLKPVTYWLCWTCVKV